MDIFSKIILIFSSIMLIGTSVQQYKINDYLDAKNRDVRIEASYIDGSFLIKNRGELNIQITDFLLEGKSSKETYGVLRPMLIAPETTGELGSDKEQFKNIIASSIKKNNFKISLDIMGRIPSLNKDFTIKGYLNIFRTNDVDSNVVVYVVSDTKLE